eukprot:scaffold334_cov241-Pinguiococcus_pyrenoidosus.AAC.50
MPRIFRCSSGSGASRGVSRGGSPSGPPGTPLGLASSAAERSASSPVSSAQAPVAVVSGSAAGRSETVSPPSAPAVSMSMTSSRSAALTTATWPDGACEPSAGLSVRREEPHNISTNVSPRREESIHAADDTPGFRLPHSIRPRCPPCRSRRKRQLAPR